MKRRFRQYSIVTLAFISGLMLSAAVLNQNMQIQSDNTWAGVSFDSAYFVGRTTAGRGCAARHCGRCTE
ncbi:MAG: hypothetical protein IPO91_34560 [Chloroflexi bacterium]|nr:hypothetical protein [Chloroflexota bacterium]